jgi:hypothetical protein
MRVGAFVVLTATVVASLGTLTCSATAAERAAKRTSPFKTTGLAEEAYDEAYDDKQAPKNDNDKGCNACGYCDSLCDGCCNDSCCLTPNVCWCDPLWTVRAGSVLLQRSGGGNTTIMADTATGAPILSGNSFGFGTQGGIDVAAMRRIGPNHDIQGRYFGIDGWNAQNTITPVGGVDILTNPNLVGLGATAINNSYISRLNSGEINWRTHSTNWFSWLVGFRWVELTEDLESRLTFPDATANTMWQTNNHLYGAQTGADIKLWDRGGVFWADSFVRAGIFGNHATNTFNLTQTVGPPFNTTQTSGQTAFVGEVGLTGNLRLTDWLSLRAGYEVLWLDGVAVASDQVPATNIFTNNGIDTTNSLFYHGALVGATVVW